MPVVHRPSEIWTGRDDPEDGAAALRLHHLCTDGGANALLGFACDAGVRRNLGRPGAAAGPQALRAAMRNLAAPEGMRSFAELGDIAVEGDDLEDGQAALAATICEALGTHARLVVLGGGHETALASYLGQRRRFADARIGILNIDAHLDLRLPGPRGGSSGTAFAQIRALEPARFDYLCLGAAAEANTQALYARAREWGVGIVSDEALLADATGAHAAIDALAARNDLVYLTICLDVLANATGVSAPATRGLPFALVETLVARVLSHGKTRLSDIVELAPEHDVANTTARMGAYLARRLLAA